MGFLGEAEASSVKRVIAYQLVRFMEENQLSKTAMAERMRTSRSALDRPLGPSNPSVTLRTMDRAAQALGEPEASKPVGTYPHDISADVCNVKCNVFCARFALEAPPCRRDAEVYDMNLVQ